MSSPLRQLGCACASCDRGIVTTPLDLPSLLIPPDDSPADKLDAFISHRLYEAGIWPSARTSDGVAAFRVVDRSADRLSVCGRIWDIGQTVHPFWLVIERNPLDPTRVTWALYFEPDVTMLSTRQARDAVDAISDPRDVPWHHTLGGEGSSAGGALVATAGSIG